MNLKNIFRTGSAGKSLKVTPANKLEDTNYIITSGDGDIFATVCGTLEQAKSMARKLAIDHSYRAPFIIHELCRRGKISIELLESD